MDCVYIENNTKDWTLLDGDNSVGLWSYWDDVYWCEKYCIKVNGVVRSVLDDTMNIYNVFEIVKECL